MAETGLSNFHIALMSTPDTAKTAAKYDAYEYIAPSVKIAYKPKIASGELYGDNAIIAADQKTTEIELEVTISGLSTAQRAKYLGHTLDNGKVVTKSTDIAPYVSAAWESIDEDNKKEYYKLYKGKFADSEESLETAGSSIKYGTYTLKGKFVYRKNDHAIGAYASEADTDYKATTGQNWYSSVDDTASATTTTP